MKKLLFFAITLIMVSCKDKPNDGVKDKDVIENGGETAEQTPCESCPTMNSDTYTRLQTQGQIICDLCLYEGIADEHVITQGNYNSYTDLFWGSSTKAGSDIEWGTIKTLIGNQCYQNHVVFTFPTTKTPTITSFALGQFSTTYISGKSHYSIPFFRGIALKHNLCNTSDITFTKGIKEVNGVNRVI
ncbi:MAG TPA: hypothetical protein VEA37_02750, partial [Flavobacterium sp.]|nr:hypothetical protein [Flavobacterium sp.]